jgi:hypothetical protein
VGLFHKAAERGRGWVAAATGGFGNGGLSVYEGGTPMARDARYTVNGVPPHIPQIWAMYDAVGEFHFDARFLSACLSRCTLRVGWLDDENRIGPAFGEDGKVLDGVPSRLAKLGAKMIAGLRSAPGIVDGTGPVGGQGMLLGRTGANWIPAAECYWVATKTATGDHWEVLSTMELQPVDTLPGEKQKFRRRRHRGAPWEDFTPNFYLRIHDPHPAYSGEADSSALPLLSNLERIALLNAEGLADSKSRLKGPGALFIPSEIDFPATDDDPDGDRYLTREFVDTATIAIRDPDAASRHVPIVVRAAGDRIKQILHLRFDYNDTALIEKRAAAVGDLARGVPLPYESTTGYGETSFANAFAIDGQLVRIFVPPVMDTITGFLTAGWFTKALMLATGTPLTEPPSDDIRRMVVWYDISDLVTDPDPTKVAMWAYGTDTNPNSLISRRGARRLVSIPEGDKPSPEETAERIEWAQKLRARSEKGDNRPDTDPEDGKPEDDQDGERNKDEEVGKRAMGLAQTMVTMAVDAAGSKLRGKCANRPDLKARIDGVDAADVYRVLNQTPGTIESLGGTGPLLNGAFSAFERTVTAEFVDAGRTDAADLATAATNMAKRVTLARLANPAAQLDVKAAAEFLELLNSPEE